jgi:hypothetical protein
MIASCLPFDNPGHEDVRGRVGSFFRGVDVGAPTIPFGALTLVVAGTVGAGSDAIEKRGSPGRGISEN